MHDRVSSCRFTHHYEVSEIARPRREIKWETNDVGCMLVNSHYRNKDGYACVVRNGKTHLMHRFLFEEKFGKIDKGLILRHKCDNPNCINLDHLELGTDKENADDRDSRGRSAKGVKHGSSKLDEGKVRYILTSEESTSTLSIMFGVHKNTINRVKSRETWSHVKI